NLAKTQKDPIKRAQKILEYSSMPSTSRHHWGTDMDLNALNNEYFTTGEGRKIYDWLNRHAAEFGFCQPYTAGRPVGYNEEKWHWSHMPVSKPLTDFCQSKMFNDKITGFLGSQTAISIDIVKKYMLGINLECL
ncbi:MAG: M15 family metallopeptidase, partial [Saprospiraceae bacterium]